ncbi:MAG: hypothetical protein ACOH16_02100 [Propionibacteriaceae bacterium]
MSTTTSPVTAPTDRVARPRVVLRWLLSFVGFPLGGLAAMLLVGPVDSVVSAVLGGLVTGSVLGAVQAWALRVDRRTTIAWVAATAVGLAAGLAVGTGIVGFRTGLADLALQGAVSGGLVGLSQAIVKRRVGGLAAVWPLYLASAWAIGWTITTSIGVQVEDQFTVFGAAGAVTVAALTSVLPLVLSRTTRH